MPGGSGSDRRSVLRGLAAVTPGLLLGSPAKTVIRPGDRLQKAIIRRRFEDVGVRSGSKADPVANSRALAAALQPGSRLEARAGEHYPIATAIRMPDGAALTGSDGAEPPVLFLPARHFGHRGGDPVADRYAAHAVGIDCSGSADDAGWPARNILLAGFVLESEALPGRQLRGVVARNVTGLRVEGVTIRGIPLGVGLCLASVRGQSRLVDVTVRDFFDDSLTWTGLPQSTGIEIDNDLVGGMPSSDLLIDRAAIHDIRVGLRFLARYGPQTDGINIASPDSSRIHIRRPVISGVEEGIDLFGCDCVIEDAALDGCRTFGLKLIHGAARNVVRRGHIRRSGLAGIVLAGSEQADRATCDNRFDDLRIHGIDPWARWAENDSAGIRLDGGRPGKVRDNLFANCAIDPGSGGRYGWLDLSEAGGNNQGVGLKIVTGPRTEKAILIAHGGSTLS